jgi:hypothetical protein
LNEINEKNDMKKLLKREEGSGKGRNGVGVYLAVERNGDDSYTNYCCGK